MPGFIYLLVNNSDMCDKGFGNFVKGFYVEFPAVAFPGLPTSYRNLLLKLYSLPPMLFLRYLNGVILCCGVIILLYAVNMHHCH